VTIAKIARVPRGIENLLLGLAEHDNCLELAALKVLKQLVKVAVLVVAAEDQHGRPRHRLNRLDGRVRVGTLGVVDVAHAVKLPHKLDAVFHAGECAQRLAHRVSGDTHAEREQ